MKMRKKFGIKTFIPLSAITTFLTLGTGATKGWNYYSNYKHMNMFKFGYHVYKKHGTNWW